MSCPGWPEIRDGPGILTSMALDVAAEVLANLPLSADFNRLSLAAPAIAAATAPGQFVMVKANTSHDPLLRRPFSVFEVLRSGDGTAIGLTILNKRIGATTRLLYDAKPGQRIACLGPLGLPWPVIDAGTEREACLRGVSLVLTTEDGSAGEHGRVTAPLERHLAERQSAAAVYACGPEAMMARSRGWPCGSRASAMYRSNASWVVGSAVATAAWSPCAAKP